MIYGFTVNEDGTATLNKMHDVGTGNGFMGSRWEIEPVKTGSKNEIMQEVSRLNRELAQN